MACWAIDDHCHLGQPKASVPASGRFLADELIARMDRNGIDKTEGIRSEGLWRIPEIAAPIPNLMVDSSLTCDLPYGV